MKLHFGVYFCLPFFVMPLVMARKSNLVPNSISTFDPRKHLTRSKIVLEDDIAIVIFEWSKTIQFGQRILKIP